jgi:hypothetical protein
MTYVGAVRGGDALVGVVADFVEVILVQLADEAGEVAVLEVLGEDVLGELFVLRGSARAAAHSDIGSGTSKTTKLLPSLPHRTMCWSAGFSSILRASDGRVIAGGMTTCRACEPRARHG